MYIYKEKRLDNFIWQKESLGTITEDIGDIGYNYNFLNDGERLVVQAFGERKDLTLKIKGMVEVERHVQGKTIYIGYIDIEEIYEDFYDFLEALYNYKFDLLERVSYE